MSQRIAEAADLAGVIPVGLIAERVERDRYNNQVSIITLCDGRTYRMVHHTPDTALRQRATIYAGRGVFVRVRTYSPTRDTECHTCDVAGYEVSWGDGDNLGAIFTGASGQSNEGLLKTLRQIQDDNFDLVIVSVIAAIADDDSAWERKDVNR